MANHVHDRETDIIRLIHAAAASRCRHIKVDGTQCHSPALRARDFCFYHHQQRIRPKKITLPILEDTISVQAAIAQVCQAAIDGSIEPKIASLVLFGLQTASSNVRHTVLNTTFHELVTDVEGLESLDDDDDNEADDDSGDEDDDDATDIDEADETEEDEDEDQADNDEDDDDEPEDDEAEEDDEEDDNDEENEAQDDDDEEEDDEEDEAQDDDEEEDNEDDDDSTDEDNSQAGEQNVRASHSSSIRCSKGRKENPSPGLPDLGKLSPGTARLLLKMLKTQTP